MSKGRNSIVSHVIFSVYKIINRTYVYSYKIWDSAVIFCIAVLAGIKVK